MENDVTRLAMEQAARAFGKDGRVFNGANFSSALCRIANVRGSIDGLLVRTILAGRADCKLMSGGSHYQLVDQQ